MMKLDREDIVYN